MNVGQSIALYGALGVSAIACITDVRTRRIPNVLTFGAALAGLIFHLATGSVAGLEQSIAGWFVGLLLFLPFFLLGGMGGGDVKLLAALGAWVGFQDVFWLAIYASIAGGVIGIGVALTTNYLGTAFRNIRTMLVSWCLVGPQPVPSMTLADSKAPRLAYAIPVLVGTMVVVWLR